MCGICGIFDIHGKGKISSEIVKEMTKTLIYRGPDDISYYENGRIQFGFTRLSIIGIDNGKQPIENENKDICMICNGEIFNYKELKSKLIELGHIFRTNTDVEVIVHLYEEYGDRLLDYIDGQFAFAIFDFKHETLLCARDHLGIIPLFFTISNGYFIFASEIKAILKSNMVRRRIDLVSLDTIITFPGMKAPRTLFKDISSLENGHYLTINKEGNMQVKEYWDLMFDEHAERKSTEYYIETLDGLLTKSVRKRLNADVDVGFYLSGGLDSSLIAAKIKDINGCNEKIAFSVDFMKKEISERKFQKIMVDYLGCKHKEIVVNDFDICSRLKDIVYHSESMLKETYNVASLMLSETVKKSNIKVILTGEGADELFAGYIGYQFDQFRKMKLSISSDITEEDKIRERLWGDKFFFYEKDYGLFTNEKKLLYSKQLRNSFEEFNCLNYRIINKDSIKNLDVVNKRSYIDYKLRLPEHLLADHGDRMAMANSVECRYPFLDKELVEFAANIPVDLKLRNFNEKYILKQVAKKYIPNEIVKRKKFAFVAPGSVNLLKQNSEYLEYILSYDMWKKNGYLDPDMVEGLKKKYLVDGFKLNLPFDSDLLIYVITLGIFIDMFQIESI